MSAPRRVSPEAPARRGWCPSLARPMPTGDGLLARVHPPLGRLSPAQARAVADGARRFGNGHVDVTARANLQVRGVTEATRCGLAEALDAVGLGDVRGDGGPQRLTLTTPLAGLEADAIPALADAIEAIGRAIPGLPPKTLVAVESATRGLALGASEADLHLVAGPDGLALHLAGETTWWRIPGADPRPAVDAALRLLAASGQRRMRDVSAEARTGCLKSLGLRRVPGPSGISTLSPGLLALGGGSPIGRGQLGSPLLAGEGQGEVRDLPGDGPHLTPALSFQERERGGASRANRHDPHDDVLMEGSRRSTSGDTRGSPLLEGEGQGEVRDLPGDGPHLTPALSFQERESRRVSDLPSDPARTTISGRHRPPAPADGARALLVDAPFGRCTADALARLADAADAAGANDLRLSPTRGFLLVCSDPRAAETAQKTLAGAGFLTEADDPRGAVAACPGAPACASGSTPTLADAARLAEAFRPFAARGLRAHVSGCAKGCAHPGAADLTLVGRDGRYDVVLSGRPDALPATRLPFEAALERVRRADSARSLAEILPEHTPGPGPS